VKNNKVQVRVYSKDLMFDLPSYTDSGCSGMDVRANIKEKISLNPLERVLIPTGLRFELPENLEIQVRPRSGLALKQGITVLNTPGTVDESYRGEVGVVLINLSNKPVVIEPGDRIAQLVFAEVTKVSLVEIEKIDENTERGSKGFGDSGVK